MTAKTPFSLLGGAMGGQSHTPGGNGTEARRRGETCDCLYLDEGCSSMARLHSKTAFIIELGWDAHEGREVARGNL